MVMYIHLGVPQRKSLAALHDFPGLTYFEKVWDILCIKKGKKLKQGV